MGQQIEESFIYELNRRGEVVVDFKLTGSIKVTRRGLRDEPQLSGSLPRLPISRILTGTFSRNKQGIWSMPASSTCVPRWWRPRPRA